MVEAAAAQVNRAGFNLRGETMLHRVFHQRLQDHAWYQQVERYRVEFLYDFQLVMAEAGDFDVEIVVEKLELLAQGNERVALAQQPSQDIAESYDHQPRRIGIRAHQRRNRIQRVEQEVRIDLALQRLHARLQKQSFLLLQLHLDAHVVQHLQRDCHRHHRARVDGELHPQVRRIERKHAAREQQVKLNVNELERQDQEEERRLPIDE